MKIMFDEKKIKECLKYIKDLKNFSIENELGLSTESLIIRILKNNKVFVSIRISYQALVLDNFGCGERERNAIGILCLDILSSEDEEKIFQIINERYSNFSEGFLKDNFLHLKEKERHENSIKRLRKGCKYVDVKTDDYSDIMECIETYLKSNNIVDYENLNHNDFEVLYHIEYDD